MTTTRRTLLAGLTLAALVGIAQAEPAPKPVLSGGWAATGGMRTFQGGWSAELTAETPDAAQGSWTMVDAQANVVLQGTWAANRTKKGWRGAWSARLAGTNDVLRGTWEADASTLKGAKTFRDMLQRGSEVQIAGTWRMGRARGTWWLRPLPAHSS